MAKPASVTTSRRSVDEPASSATRRDRSRARPQIVDPAAIDAGPALFQRHRESMKTVRKRSQPDVLLWLAGAVFVGVKPACVGSDGGNAAMAPGTARICDIRSGRRSRTSARRTSRDLPFGAEGEPACAGRNHFVPFTSRLNFDRTRFFAARCSLRRPRRSSCAKRFFFSGEPKSLVHLPSFRTPW